MAINKHMQAALRLLSYPAAADLEKVYKIERALYTLKSSPLSPLYHLWDQKIESIDGTPIRVRIYTPKQQTSSQLLLFFHGGGWVFESVDTYNQVCKALAKAIGCRIATVEYRRAPEFPSRSVWRTVTRQPRPFTPIPNSLACSPRTLPSSATVPAAI